jgi:methionyl aminopeptidase
VVEYKTPGEIDAMRAAGRVVARILAAVRARAAPGVRLSELDATARDVLAKADATSPFLGYQPSFADTPFPAVICASVNDAVLHDIPGRYRLKDGDLLSVRLRRHPGRLGRRRCDLRPGRPPAPGRDPPDRHRDPGAASGHRRRRPRRPEGDISAAIGAVGRAARYGICTDFGGHGIGHAMHEDPHIPNTGRPGRGPRLVPGLVIAIEPWFLAGGTDACKVDSNGWTIRSTDGSRAAHVEHTIAITDDGPLVLTAPA